MEWKFDADPQRTAVLAMDFQTSIIAAYVKDGDALMARTRKVLDGARAAGAHIMHVAVGFRPGAPEISPNNLVFGAIKASGQLGGGANLQIHPAITPEASDIVVTKHRVGAFAGTDLDMILRANAIDHLVLMGVATSGVVLSTLRHAADADYRLTVIEDCCADADDEAHRCLVSRIFTRQAKVVNSAELFG
jgi:nicotinamidase-related amidase